MQGSGIPGISWSSAQLALQEDGSFALNTGASDLGTGSDTVLCQIAAEVLGVGLDRIRVLSADTDFSPYDVGAYASGTTIVAGNAVKKCAEIVVRKILDASSKMLGVVDVGLQCNGGFVKDGNGRILASLPELARHSVYVTKQVISGSAEHLSPDSPPPFCAQFAEVEVDKETGIVRVVSLVTAVDLGFAINPKLAEGQVEGAVAQGVGFALSEIMLFDSSGRMVNPTFREYCMVGPQDIPHMKTILVTTHEPLGPFGAKSVGEIAVNVSAPAIANAVCDAMGVRVRQLPLSPETIWLAARELKL